MSQGTADSIRAGKAHVELGVDQKPLDSGLDTATKKLNRWTEAIKKTGKGEMLSGALQGGGVGLAAAAGGIAARAVFDEYILNQRTIQQELERTTELQAKWLERFSTGLAQVRQRLAEVGNVAGTGQGLDRYQVELEAAQKELGGLESSLKEARREYESFNSLFSSKENFSLWLSAPISGGLEAEQAKAKPALDAAKKAYEDQLKLISEIQKKQFELQDPSRSREALRSMREFTDGLAEQAATLERKNKFSERELQLKKIADRHGFATGSSEFLQALDQAKKLDVAESVEKFIAAVDAQTERIQNAHLDDDEFKLMKLGQGELSIEDWARMNDALREKRIAEAVEAAQHWVEDVEPIAAQGLGTRGAFSFASGSQFFGGAEGILEQQLKVGERSEKLLGEIAAALEDNPLTIA